MYTLGIQLERKRLEEVEELAEKKARERLADEMAAQYEQAQEEKPVPPKPDDTGADTCPSYAIEVTKEEEHSSGEDLLSTDDLSALNDPLGTIHELQAGFECYNRWLTKRDETARTDAIRIFEHSLANIHEYGRKQLDATAILAAYYKESDSEKYRHYCFLGRQAGNPLLAYAYGIIMKRSGNMKEALASFKTAALNDSSTIPARFQYVSICLQSDDLFFNYKDDVLRFIDEGIQAAETLLEATPEIIKESIKDEHYGFYILRGQVYLKLREQAVNDATYNDYTDLAIQSFETAYHRIRSHSGPVQLSLLAVQNLAKLYALKGDETQAEYYKRKSEELRQML